MLESLKKYDWDSIRDALYLYAEYIRENEPYAVNTIAVFEAAAEECPTKEDFK